MKLDALYEARLEAKCPACAHSARSSAPEAAPASPCRPWLKVERNEAYYEACMAIAEKIGAIDHSRKAFEVLRAAVGQEDQEVFGALYLDTHNQIRGLAETARGEIDSVPAPIVPTLRIAIAEAATSLVVFHTHPTLYAQPSDADVATTLAFDEACSKVNLLLMDHLIIGGQRGYYSFLDHGVLK